MFITPLFADIFQTNYRKSTIQQGIVRFVDI